MASAKLPPRQKMINMMYLVLTAILALNVSKEVLDAFAIMDAELVRSERAHEQRSQVEYAVFADMAKRFPDKFAAKHEEAKRVKAMADSIVSHLEGIKTATIAKADGLEPRLLRGTDADGRDTLRALLMLEKKDDRDVLTHALVGSEPGSPRTGDGSAHGIRMRITAFRDSLKGLAGEKGQALSASLDALFDFSDRRDASGTLNNWESINFYDVPLAAGIATLSKLQADVRAAENDMVKWLYRSAELEDYRFGTLTTAVVPQSSLIMLGDSFRADVFLAAYDPRNPAQVKLKDGQELPIGTDGKAKLRVRGNAIGEQRVEGSIRFDGPKGIEEIPYATSYQVMAPLLVASPTKMNVLYRGVENPIELSVPGIAAERIQASISTGRISRSGNGWVATGMTDSKAEVFATATLADGSTRRIGPVMFRVKNLPPPSAYVKDKGSADTWIALNDLKHAPGVTVKTNTEFGDVWTAKSYTFSFQRGSSNPIDHVCQGAAFSSDIKQVIAKVRPGDKIVIENIAAQLSNGQGPVVKLGAIALKVR
ncbi:MAG: gliding motility protein GldM [Flavobacteriales bacterium]|jgi:gliding motility-associated protein GldM|nr:gliding motility protein GldM [Flavobacteriales bacterium]